jgi:Tfp pilus assembly protein PilE
MGNSIIIILGIISVSCYLIYTSLKKRDEARADLEKLQARINENLSKKYLGNSTFLTDTQKHDAIGIAEKQIIDIVHELETKISLQVDRVELCKINPMTSCGPEQNIKANIKCVFN